MEERRCHKGDMIGPAGGFLVHAPGGHGEASPNVKFRDVGAMGTRVERLLRANWDWPDAGSGNCGLSRGGGGSARESPDNGPVRSGRQGSMRTGWRAADPKQAGIWRLVTGARTMRSDVNDINKRHCNVVRMGAC